MTTASSAPPNRSFLILATGDGAELYPFAFPPTPFVPLCADSRVRQAPPSCLSPPSHTDTEHLTISLPTIAALSTSAHGQFPH